MTDTDRTPRRVRTTPDDDQARQRSVAAGLAALLGAMIRLSLCTGLLKRLAALLGAMIRLSLCTGLLKRLAKTFQRAAPASGDPAQALTAEDRADLVGQINVAFTDYRAALAQYRTCADWLDQLEADPTLTATERDELLDGAKDHLVKTQRELVASYFAAAGASLTAHHLDPNAPFAGLPADMAALEADIDDITERLRSIGIPVPTVPSVSPRPSPFHDTAANYPTEPLPDTLDDPCPWMVDAHAAILDL